MMAPLPLIGFKAYNFYFNMIGRIHNFIACSKDDYGVSSSNIADFKVLIRLGI